MKRKCQEEENGESSGRGRSKSQRREEGVVELASALQARPWDLKAGMILEVNLRNFLCHEVMLTSKLTVCTLYTCTVYDPHLLSQQFLPPPLPALSSLYQSLLTLSSGYCFFVEQLSVIHERAGRRRWSK
jgi:hypothetical protein